MSELEKPFLKKKKKLKKKNKKTMSKCRMGKNHWREIEIWFKPITKPRRNYEWIGISILKKKSDPKIEKTVRIEVKLRPANKKPLARKRTSVQTPFSPSTLKLEKKLQATKPLAFSLHFLFRRDQNHYSNLTSKIIKMCEQILKKRSREKSGNDSK